MVTPRTPRRHPAAQDQGVRQGLDDFLTEALQVTKLRNLQSPTAPELRHPRGTSGGPHIPLHPGPKSSKRASSNTSPQADLAILLLFRLQTKSISTNGAVGHLARLQDASYRPAHRHRIAFPTSSIETPGRAPAMFSAARTIDLIQTHRGSAARQGRAAPQPQHRPGGSCLSRSGQPGLTVSRPGHGRRGLRLRPLRR